MQVLLSCGVQDLPTDAAEINEIGFTAEDIGDYLYDVLSKYNKEFDCIEFIVGDNASVNRLLANRIKEWLLKNKNIRRTIPLIGCASHKLNLAVQSLYSHGTPEHEVVEKVHRLMIELGTLKNRMKLATQSPLSPIKRNDTRWGSVFAMLKRYLEFYDKLPKCEFSRYTRSLFLSVEDHYVIEELVATLHRCERTSQFLQSEDAKEVNILSTRVAFDILLKDVPQLSTYLAADASIVHCPAFESAVVKLQSGDDQLSAEEVNAVEIFKIQDNSALSSTAPDEVRSFQDEMRLAVEARKASKGQGKGYRSTFHISPTSNIVERLFSRAGIVMSPLRRHMDPSTLEMLLMLRVNKHMWSEETLQNIIDMNKAAARDAAIDRSKRKRNSGADLVVLDDENSD